jgi:hypothetical protein
MTADGAQEPPIFAASDFAFGAGGGAATATDAAGWIEFAAFIAFFGTIAFCTLQAVLAPRKTFCAEKMAAD